MQLTNQIMSLKGNNRKQVLDLLRNSGTVSIAEISMATTISKPTVKKIVDYYCDRSMVVCAGKGHSTDGGGKKPELFKFNENYGYTISIHITPDSIYSGIADMKADFHDLQRLPIKKNEKMDIILDYFVEIIQNFQGSKFVKRKELIGIAIAFPGMVDPFNGVSIYSPHYHSWENNYPFKEELLKRIDLDAEIFMDCTNRFQAFAEREKGIAKGKDNFFIVDAIKEGLGAGIIVGGYLKRGAQNLSGEIGHMIINPDSGIKCICGAEGCFEAMVSTERISKWVRDEHKNHKNSLIFKNRKPESVKIDHIFSAFKNGDDFAQKIIDDIIKWFAIGLSNIIVVYDPQMIIIQGIYVDTGDYFINNLRDKIRQYSLPAVDKKVVIEYSNLGWERGVLGGAAYVAWNFFENEQIYRTVRTA
ncbi:MAG TPA: ROK family protein [Spirochaetes bacterium]|nr:ROK family protein [Spirochaetota bacterium]